MTNSKQYTLPLFDEDMYILDDFITSLSNQVALDAIKKWSISWGCNPFEFVLLIHGSPSSGKTYLTKIWQNLSGAYLIKNDSDIISEEHIQCYKAFIIEDIELWDEQKALHCFNLISEYRKYLLITTKNSVNNFALQDLSSRINSVIKLEIKRPDDELMRILIFKHFSDHAVIVSDNVIEYLLIILPRQFDQIIKSLKAITHFALVHKKAITISLIKQVLN
jgi:chromosomal replication initiation ATPase DnaA